MLKLNGKSFPTVQENIEKLKMLFPEIVNTGGVDFDQLRLLLGDNVINEWERYEFIWNGKTEAIQLAQKQTTGTLRPCKEESVNWDSTENLYIEGDNLEVLRVLQNSYRNKVKMIYIDPPYNTGKDFVYKDNFHDNVANYKERMDESYKSNAETSGRYHTDWLNMMYPRLKIARNLLKEDGVIFISIDDNELPNIIKICDEVFGEDNFIGVFTVNSTPNARDYGHIGKMHEYIIFYGKMISKTDTKLLADESKTFKYRDDKGNYNIHPLYNSNESFNNENRPNLFYPFYLNPNNSISEEFYEISLDKKVGYIEIYPPLSQKNKVQFVWRWGRTKAKENLNSEIIGYKVGEGEYRVVQKMRNDEKLIRSLLIDKEFSSRRGTAEVERLFNQKVFSFPKPLQLIKQLLLVSTADESIVIDLFSGSSTTAHALMELNAEDGGKRKHIMVQLPEPTDEKSAAYNAGYKNICEIGKERIRRAGKQIVEKNKNKEGIDDLDIGFKVFKLDETNLKIWDEETPDLQAELWNQVEPVKEGRTHEDVVYEILLKYGIDLTVPIEEKQLAGKKLFSVGMDYLLVCLERDLTLEFIEAMLQAHPDCRRIVFYDEGFKNETVRINAEQLLKRYGIEDIRVI